MYDTTTLLVLAVLFEGGAVTAFLLLKAYGNDGKASNDIPVPAPAVQELPRTDRRAKKTDKEAPAPAHEKAPTKKEIESAAKKAGIKVTSLQKWLDEKRGSASKETSMKEFYRILGELEKPSGKKLAVRQARPT